jgi:hypothetical protein
MFTEAMQVLDVKAKLVVRGSIPSEYAADECLSGTTLRGRNPRQCVLV